MRLHVTDHPLIAHKLTALRDKNTPSPVFRQLVEELVTLLAYEATREVVVHDVEIETPMATTIGTALAKPRPIVVPILRAGLGMLEGMSRLLPTAEPWPRSRYVFQPRTGQLTLSSSVPRREGIRRSLPGRTLLGFARRSR